MNQGEEVELCAQEYSIDLCWNMTTCLERNSSYDLNWHEGDWRERDNIIKQISYITVLFCTLLSIFLVNYQKKSRQNSVGLEGHHK